MSSPKGREGVSSGQKWTGEGGGLAISGHPFQCGLRSTACVSFAKRSSSSSFCSSSFAFQFSVHTDSGRGLLCRKWTGVDRGRKGV